jgi:hypothetical protein
MKSILIWTHETPFGGEQGMLSPIQTYCFIAFIAIVIAICTYNHNKQLNSSLENCKKLRNS